MFGRLAAAPGLAGGPEEEVERGPATIHSIGDDTLALIFSFCSAKDRFQSIPLVCKDWQYVVTDPRFLHTVDAHCTGIDCGHKLDSLGRWMDGYGAGNVRRLKLHVAPYFESPAHYKRSVAEFLGQLLAFCGSEGGLEELTLHVEDMAALDEGDYHVIPVGIDGTWGPTMRDLRRLSVWHSGPLPVTAHLGGSTALEELSLTGGNLTFEDAALAEEGGVSLPPSLTWLDLCGLQGERLPEQLTALSRLDTLFIRNSPMAGDAYESLARLTSLQRLDLAENSYLPTCLSRLTHLTALRLLDTPGHPVDPFAATEAVDEALATLTQLRQLAVSVKYSTPHHACPALPTSLSALQRLESFVWDGPPPVLTGLPEGPWLVGLRQLAVPASVAAANLDILSQAQQLEVLGLVNGYYQCGTLQQRLEVAQWAATSAYSGACSCPALRWLDLNVSHTFEARGHLSQQEWQQQLEELGEACEEARLRNPQLRLELEDQEGQGQVYQELLFRVWNHVSAASI